MIVALWGYCVTLNTVNKVVLPWSLFLTLEAIRLIIEISIIILPNATKNMNKFDKKIPQNKIGQVFWERGIGLQEWKWIAIDFLDRMSRNQSSHSDNGRFWVLKKIHECKKMNKSKWKNTAIQNIQTWNILIIVACSLNSHNFQEPLFYQETRTSSLVQLENKLSTSNYHIDSSMYKIYRKFDTYKEYTLTVKSCLPLVIIIFNGGMSILLPCRSTTARMEFWERSLLLN